jgi:hypothetical protein
MFVAVSRAQTKIAPELIRLLVFRFAVGVEPATGVLNHVTTALYARSRESHYPLRHPLPPKIPLGAEASTGLNLLHHGT